MSRRKEKDYITDYRKQEYSGKPCRRGQSVLYPEKKKQKNISLTPTAIAILNEESRKAGLPDSEFIERWLRSLKSV